MIRRRQSRYVRNQHSYRSRFAAIQSGAQLIIRSDKTLWSRAANSADATTVASQGPQISPFCLVRFDQVARIIEKAFSGVPLISPAALRPYCVELRRVYSSECVII